MAQGDMFIKIEGSKQGPLKGEAQDPAHKDEIDVTGWSWGMEGSAVHTTGLAAKTTIHELRISKRVDSASTALMSCLRNNELIKKAVLTVRKAGGDEAIEYFKITIEKARITSLLTRSAGESGTSQLIEELSLAFAKVSVEYTPQGADGLPRGGMLFETEIFPA